MANVHRASAYLLRFEEPETGPSPVEELIDPPPVFSQEPLTDALNQYEHQLENLRRAYDDLLATQQDHERVIEEAVESARRAWLQKEGENLAKVLKEEIDAGFASLRADVARILEPFVGKQMSDVSVSELISILRHAMFGAEEPVLRIEGPKNLLESLSASFANDPFSCELVETEVADVKIVLPATHMQTRIDEWLRTLQKTDGVVRDER